MRVSYNDLIDGKAIKIKNNKFLDTRSYVQQFIDIVSKYVDNIRYSATESDWTISNGIEDGHVYTKVLIEAIGDNPYYMDYCPVHCLAYGIDTAIPVYKVYKGFISKSKGCFLIGYPNTQFIDYINPGSGFDYEKIREFLSSGQNTDKIETLSNMEIPYQDQYIAEMLGDWIMKVTSACISSKFGKVMLPAESVIKAYKLLYTDMNSPYYICPGKTSSLLNIYEAWASTIADNHRDLLNRFEKTTLLENILK